MVVNESDVKRYSSAFIQEDVSTSKMLGRICSPHAFSRRFSPAPFGAGSIHLFRDSHTTKNDCIETIVAKRPVFLQSSRSS